MTVVLVHGNPETEAIWGPLIDAMGHEDVVCLSPPGFGDPLPTDFSATYVAYRDWLEDQLEGIDEPVDLVGHDWGGGPSGSPHGSARGIGPLVDGGGSGSRRGGSDAILGLARLAAYVVRPGVARADLALPFALLAGAAIFRSQRRRRHGRDAVRRRQSQTGCCRRHLQRLQSSWRMAPRWRLGQIQQR